MNPFEKLLMIVVPSMGLVAIMYFFTWYLPDIENGHFYDTQRLQGVTSYQSKVVYRKTDTLKPMRHAPKAKVNSYNARKKNNYRSKVKHIKRTVYKQTQKQYDPYLEELKYYDNQRIQEERRINEKRRRALKQKQQHKKANNQKCTYYQKMKDQIRDRMRKGYKASQYNWLKNRKRHWAKLYSDNCFGGYRYPR